MNNFQAVYQIHGHLKHNFVVTLCPNFKKTKTNCTPFLNYVRSRFDCHVITLVHKWDGQQPPIAVAVSSQVCNVLQTHNQLYAPQVIKKSAVVFTQRSRKIRDYIISNAV